MAAPQPDPPPVLPWRGTTTKHRSRWPEGYWRMVVWRGLRLRCPVCGQGRLFRTYFAMHEHCSCCGVGFAREHGQWVGSLATHTCGVAFLLMTGAASSPSWPLPVSLAIWCTAAVVVPLITFRFSR